MMTRFAALIASAAVLAAPGLGMAQSGKTAQKENVNTWPMQQTMQIVKSVRHQLLTLPDYDVFDWLTFSVQGHTVVLHGDASRPALKSEAEKAVKNIKGVQSVQNDIKVLPYSPLDDRIRVATLVRIYGEPALRKYTSAPISQDLFPTVAREAGGITEDPPHGYFAIHIIVNGGHVELDGVVDSAMDAEIADSQANSVPGVFSVDDDLIVPGKQKQLK